jgi:hypothetical protein
LEARCCTANLIAQKESNYLTETFAQLPWLQIDARRPTFQDEIEVEHGGKSVVPGV